VTADPDATSPDPSVGQARDLSEDSLPPPDPEGPGLFGDAPPASRAGGSYRVLARAYRPTRFDELIGQDSMVRILRRAFALGRVAHGFMLTGVRGTGKTTTARIIARGLNCIGPDGGGGPTADPCGVCPDCTAILADRHPDVLEMDAASRTGVDDMREIIDQARFRPMQGRMKVFIIDEVHMLSRNAFNALLKTLEEPPEQVTFILATTELRKVPVTVLSRCQRFDLRRVSQAQLAAHFAAIARREGASVEPEALALIARAADGSVRDGLSLLDQAISMSHGDPAGGDPVHGDLPQSGARQEEAGGRTAVGSAAVAEMLGLADRGLVFDLLEAVLAGRMEEVLGITGQIYLAGTDLGQVLTDMLELVHTVSRLKAVPSLRDSPELPEAERVRGGAIADRLGMAALARVWQMLLKGIGEVEMAPQRRDAAEMVLIRLCHLGDLPTPGELIRRLSGPGAGDVPSFPATPAALGSGSPVPASPSERGQGRGPQNPGAQNSGAHNLGAQHPATRHGGAQEFAAREPTAEARSPQGQGNGRGAAQGHGHGQGQAPVVVSPPASGGGYASSALAVAPRPDAPELQEPEPRVPEPHALEPQAPEPQAGAASARVAPRSWREVVALVAAEREATLHGHLRHCVHPVRFAPPVIEVRLQPQAPRDLTQRLAALLGRLTGTRWTIAVSREPGEPTLAEQSDALAALGRSSAESHPLVRAILEAFPGARLGRMNDSRLDEYGLLPEIEDAPPLDFAPLGAEPVTLDDLSDDPDPSPET